MELLPGNGSVNASTHYRFPTTFAWSPCIATATPSLPIPTPCWANTIESRSPVTRKVSSRCTRNLARRWIGLHNRAKTGVHNRTERRVLKAEADREDFGRSDVAAPPLRRLTAPKFHRVDGRLIEDAVSARLLQFHFRDLAGAADL